MPEPAPRSRDSRAAVEACPSADAPKRTSLPRSSSRRAKPPKLDAEARAMPKLAVDPDRRGRSCSAACRSSIQSRAGELPASRSRPSGAAALPLLRGDAPSTPIRRPRRRDRDRTPRRRHGRRRRRAASAAGLEAAEFVAASPRSRSRCPTGWERIDPPAGATFAAVAADGGADATLWITEDPKLDFPTFVSQSLAPARDARRLGADRRARAGADAGGHRRPARRRRAPRASRPTRSTLRVAGPYRYYLATTVQPDASARPSTASS